MKRYVFISATSFAVIAVLFIGVWALLSATGQIAGYNVPSNAMAPFLCSGDTIILEAISLHGRLPKHGEVVAFTTAGIDSPHLTSQPPMDFVKRIVGLPGDRLSFVNGVLQVNGSSDAGSFITSFFPYQPFGLLTESDDYLVPEGHVFVLGDNSANSMDSRHIGPVPVANLRFLYWFHLHRVSPRVTGAPPGTSTP